MTYAPTYQHVFTPAGRVKVYRVTQVGLVHELKFVTLTDVLGAPGAEYRDRVLLELLAMRPKFSNGRAYWLAMTRRLRTETTIKPHQKYNLKRAALGARFRDATDARQLSLLPSSESGA
jgi:hypothetical protein